MTQAYVQEIRVKPTTAGNMHDFVLSNGDTVGAGKFPPKGIAVNDYIEYEVDMRGQYKNFRAGSIKKLPAPAGVAAPAPAANTAGKRYVSNDDRQIVISKQAALNSAIAFVNLLQATDSLPTIAKAKADVKADLMQEIVDRYTAHFYKQSTGEDMQFPEKLPAGLDSAEKDTNWNEE